MISKPHPGVVRLSTVIAIVGSLLCTVCQYATAASPSPPSSQSVAEDRLDVLQLSSKYAWGIDALDKELLSTVFTADAVADYVSVPGNPIKVSEHLVGFKTIYDWLNAHRNHAENAPWHYVTNQIVEMHGDTADLRYYMHNRILSGGGVYHVHAVRTAAGWRIDQLRLEIHTWKAEAYGNETKPAK